jgi:hypothetical protein
VVGKDPKVESKDRCFDQSEDKKIIELLEEEELDLGQER